MAVRPPPPTGKTQCFHRLRCLKQWSRWTTDPSSHSPTQSVLSDESRLASQLEGAFAKEDALRGRCESSPAAGDTYVCMCVAARSRDARERTYGGTCAPRYDPMIAFVVPHPEQEWPAASV